MQINGRVKERKRISMIYDSNICKVYVMSHLIKKKKKRQCNKASIQIDLIIDESVHRNKIKSLESIKTTKIDSRKNFMEASL